MKLALIGAIVLSLLTFLGSVANAQNVKITPIGSHAGELCNRDRATIFEDPTGVRILYDAGQTVLGGDDARLGAVHVVLVSHAHGDHIGDSKLKALGAGTCDAPELVSAAPNSTSGEIAAHKNAAIVAVATMTSFLGTKVANIKGRPTAACPQSGNDIVVPQAAPCTALVQTGGTRTIRAADATKAVEITTVTAVHDSALPLALMSEALRKQLEADNLAFQVGPPVGYVIRFTNGLVAYLTGDTAVHAEMKTVIADFYKANLMLINLGQNAIAPDEAAYVANELVRPAAVIESHPNEIASVSGKPRPASRTEKFVSLVKGRPVYLALSGKTVEFDGAGKCVAGC